MIHLRNGGSLEPEAHAKFIIMQPFCASTLTSPWITDMPGKIRFQGTAFGLVGMEIIIAWIVIGQTIPSPNNIICT